MLTVAVTGSMRCGLFLPFTVACFLRKAALPLTPAVAAQPAGLTERESTGFAGPMETPRTLWSDHE